MKKIAAISLAAGIAVGLTGIPVHAASPHQAITVRKLAVDAGSFPNGATIMNTNVDKTSAAVNSDAAVMSPSKNSGGAYTRLGSYGSLYEYALLPKFEKALRSLQLMATVFPSSSAAFQAYLFDAAAIQNQGNCQPVSLPSLGVRTESCVSTAQDSTAQGSFMYTVATVGTVEFIVVGLAAADASIHLDLNMTRARAITDVSFLAKHEANHVLHLLTLAGNNTQPTTPQPLPVVKPAPIAAPAFTVTAWVTPSSMSYDAYPTLYVKSAPGASCSASVTYSTGRSPVSFDGSPQTLPANGTASWSWHEETVGSGGTATVDCTYHGQDHTADASFTVQ